MEVSLIKETDGSIKKSDTVSKSSYSQVVSVPAGGLVPANNGQETNKCEHFTIRGFVSEVRKKEMKLCWPLFKPLNHTKDEHATMAPPLSVKRFRRWNCQSCLNAPETVIGNGMVKNTPSDQVKNGYHSLIGNTPLDCEPSAIKSIASLPKQSSENFLERGVAEKDNSLHGSDCEYRPLISRDQQANELRSSHLNKSATTIPRRNQDMSHQHQKCVSQAIIVVSEGEEGQAGGNVLVRSNISEAAILEKHTIDIVSSSHKDHTESVHGIGDADEISHKMAASMSFSVAAPDLRDDQAITEMMTSKEFDKNVAEGFQMSQGELAINKDGTFLASTADPSRHDSNCLNRDRHEVIDTKKDFVDTIVHSRDDIMNPAGYVNKLQHKRAPKLRLLCDILSTKELHKTEKVDIAKGDEEASGNYKRKSDASNFEDEAPDIRSHPVSQNAEPKAKRKKAVPSDNEEPCLIHWVKKVPRKAKSSKGVAQSKHINTDVSKGKSADMRNIDLNLAYCGDGDDEEMIDEKDRSMMADVEVIKPHCIHREDELPSKGHMIGDHVPINDPARFKISGVRKSGKDLHHGIETQESKKSKKKSKKPRIEDGTSSWTHRPENPLGVWKHGFQLNKKKKRKHIITLTSHQPNDEDDIPMDIVELLAKNQHDRRLMAGMADNRSTRVVESIKDGNRLHMSDHKSAQNLPITTGTTNGDKMWGTGGAQGNKASDEIHWMECNYRTAISNDRKVECGLQSYQTLGINKEIPPFDLNQKEPPSASIGSPAFSPSFCLPASGYQLSTNNCSPQNVYWNGMEMPALCSDHVNHTTARHNYSTFSYNGSSVSTNGAPAGFRKFDLNTNNDDIYMRGAPKSVAHNNGSSVPIKNLDPLDSNETISALNLLRLIDPAAYSGVSFCSSIHNESIRSTQESVGQGNINGLTGSNGGVTNIMATKIQGTVENTDQVPHTRNYCIPFRPVPRVGVLGPLLQQEIATSSNASRPSFGSQVSSDKQSTLITDAMGKGEAFRSATVTTTMNAQSSSLSRDVNSERFNYSMCSVARDDAVQYVDNDKTDTLPPLGSTYKMETCVLNRNPADFAMPDESEYLIGFNKTKIKKMPNSRCLQPSSLGRGQKRRKMVKFNDLNESARC